jgi:hypothetical protein
MGQEAMEKGKRSQDIPIVATRSDPFVSSFTKRLVVESNSPSTIVMTMSRYLGIFAALVGIAAATSHDQQKPLTGKGSDSFICEHPPYRVHQLSKSPLVIYLDGFLTDQERAHLQDVTYVAMHYLCSLKNDILTSTAKTHSPTRAWPLARAARPSMRSEHLSQLQLPVILLSAA